MLRIKLQLFWSVFVYVIQYIQWFDIELYSGVFYFSHASRGLLDNPQTSLSKVSTTTVLLTTCSVDYPEQQGRCFWKEILLMKSFPNEHLNWNSIHLFLDDNEKLFQRQIYIKQKLFIWLGIKCKIKRGQTHRDLQNHPILQLPSDLLEFIADWFYCKFAMVETELLWSINWSISSSKRQLLSGKKLWWAHFPASNSRHMK